jgi:mono/diheme cytochrome c family protein
MRRCEVKAHWQTWTPVRRTFAALAAFLSLLLLIACGLIIHEMMAKNLLKNDLFTTDLVASQAINTPANTFSAVNNTKKPSNEVLQHGAYLAQVGNCAACHTARGGAAFAGGKPIATPFGTVYTSNITPDPATGIGRWSADAFYRALHEGRSADGHLLTPAFPYPNYTHVTRADSDDLHAYFMKTIPPVAQPNRAHDLPFPFNTQVALAFWRLMFFEKAAEKNNSTLNATAINNGAVQAINTPTNGINKGENGNLELKTDQNTQHADIQRGAYLVRGLGHCSACHAERNALGASVKNQFSDQFLSGALMPMHDWYAPSLVSKLEAGVSHLPRQDVVSLLKTGIAPNASMLGPMAEVVAGSTQFWTDADLQSTAAYLQSLPQSSDQIDAKISIKSSTSNKPMLFDKGADLFTQHCATCHGEQGQGMRVEGNVALPALAGNRAITLPNTTNLVRILLAGGYAPSTQANPRPFGMPPFVHVLNDTDIAAVTTYIRNAWGNQAEAVSAADVVRVRRGVE